MLESGSARFTEDGCAVAVAATAEGSEADGSQAPTRVPSPAGCDDRGSGASRGHAFPRAAFDLRCVKLGDDGAGPRVIFAQLATGYGLAE